MGPGAIAWIVFVMVLPWLLVGLGGWLVFQLLRRYGFLLLRLEALEQQLKRLAAAVHADLAPDIAPGLTIGAAARTRDRVCRGFSSLSDSRINRNGLPAGTPAPSFTLPRLDGGELSLEAHRGRKVLLVLSNPSCGPCDQLAPQLERLHRRAGDVQVLMVSRGDAAANRAKAAEHGLTFPIALQRQWEISRLYGMFATPIGYLIDEAGIIAAEAAVGVEPILALLSPDGAANNGTQSRGLSIKRSLAPSS